MSDITTLDRSAWRWFRMMVRASVPELWGVYEYSVFAADANGVQATRTNASLPIPDVVNVPARAGVAGTVTIPKPGSLCYVQFANGDRTKPVVTSFDASNAQQVNLNSDQVSLGASPTDFVALASKVDACMTSILAHTHTGVQTGAGTSGPSATLSLPGSGSNTVRVSP